MAQSPGKYSTDGRGASAARSGWALAFASPRLALYAGVVIVAFHLRVVFGEEPWLARTHGSAWDEYRARVPRWLM